MLCDPLINSICFDLLLESMISNKKSKARGLFTIYFFVVFQITAGAAANVFGGKNVNPHHSHFCLSSSQSYLCVLSFHISLALSLSQKYRQITSRMNCIPLPTIWGTFKGDFQDFTTWHCRKEIVLPFFIKLYQRHTIEISFHDFVRYQKISYAAIMCSESACSF